MALTGFAIALALTLFFGIRLLLVASHGPPPPRPEAPAPWMTPRYIVHTWRIPPEVLGPALGLAPEGADGLGKRTPLSEIAEAQGVPVATLLSIVAELIATQADTLGPPSDTAAPSDGDPGQ